MKDYGKEIRYKPGMFLVILGTQQKVSFEYLWWAEEAEEKRKDG